MYMQTIKLDQFNCKNTFVINGFVFYCSSSLYLTFLPFNLSFISKNIKIMFSMCWLSSVFFSSNAKNKQKIGTCAHIHTIEIFPLKIIQISIYGRLWMDKVNLLIYSFFFNFKIIENNNTSIIIGIFFSLFEFMKTKTLVSLLNVFIPFTTYSVN